MTVKALLHSEYSGFQRMNYRLRYHVELCTILTGILSFSVYEKIVQWRENDLMFADGVNQMLFKDSELPLQMLWVSGDSLSNLK